jgi:hypothetical protein
MDMTEVTKASLRAYNVGFGDCLLLRLTYSDASQRSVLIDFGSTQLPQKAPKTRMADIAANIAEASGGKLHMVVASHRHADHISGFGPENTGKVIEGLEPEIVVQPWTEAPNLKPDAKQPLGRGSETQHLALARTLTDMHAFAAGVRAEGERLKKHVEFPRTVAEKLQFLGETNLKNTSAVERLMTMGRRHLYTKFGDDLSDDTVLPGVKIRVLGPPTLKQAPAIAHQAQTDKDEFWHLAGSWGSAAAVGEASGEDLRPRVAPLFPDAVVPISQEAKWLIPRIDRAYAGGMLSLVRVMDGVLNNTSVILLMQIGHTKLLFPGDAQIENWSYALFDAPNHAEILENLSETNFYKVGHHGSLNATPKTLWNHFLHKADDSARDRLISVVSTLAGKHGSSEDHTEVPRAALVKELTAHSNFTTTQSSSSRKPWVDVEIPIR